MSEVYCTQCGTAGATGQKFCGRCGTVLATDPKAETNPINSEPSPADRTSPDPQAGVPTHRGSDPAVQPEGTEGPRVSQPGLLPDLHPESRPAQQSGRLAPAADPALFIPGRGELVRIPPGGSCTIGSDPTWDVVLDGDAYVSAHRLTVTRGGPGLLINDAQSTNGTFLRVTEPTPVKAGDEIRIGTTVVRVEMTGPGA